jgi:hypothetical protein
MRRTTSLLASSLAPKASAEEATTTGLRLVSTGATATTGASSALVGNQKRATSRAPTPSTNDPTMLAMTENFTASPDRCPLN